MRWGVPVLVLTAIEALPLWSAARTGRARANRFRTRAVTVRRRVPRRGSSVGFRYPRRVMSELLLDAAGRRRSPATLPEFHAGRPPRNKGMRYPADPPTIEEIVTVMRRAGDGAHGRRLRGL